MPTSEARIRANQMNAARSTGPRTEEGKGRSRANAFKHGLTGDGVVLPAEDAAEVERLSVAFGEELGAQGEVGHALARRMAVMSIRMDRSVDQETAALSAHIRQAVDEFEPPEGIDDVVAEKLRAEAARSAMFDFSKEACLARKYEAASERCFFRALKELQRLGKGEVASTQADMTAETQASMARLGSFLPEAKTVPSKSLPVESRPLPTPSKPKPAPTKANIADWDLLSSDPIGVPIAIGRTR
jgi:hypothetical protein